MAADVDRRKLLTGAAGLSASAAAAAAGCNLTGFATIAQAFTGVEGANLGNRVAFSFESLQDTAKELSQAAYSPAVVRDTEILNAIDYDAFQDIRYRPDKTIQLDPSGRLPVQLFHLDRHAIELVHIHVVEDGSAREVIYDQSLFDIPAGHPARDLHAGAGFAGFRVMAPDLKTDWMAAVGASYFRSSGPFNQYGLSARGIAIDTAMPHPEEFPRFSHYWVEAGTATDAPLTVYALLDGPSLTGAYRMKTQRTSDQRDVYRVVMEIEAVLFARKDIERLGVAPFSSMFWYGKARRKQSADWRPEIHDSDGLAILTGSGERIWRPINNPPRVMTSAFADHDPKAFGLFQRDRDFIHYLDDGVFYERRPSTWVEPLSAWGEGAVHLVEIPTDDETADNIVAYWAPAGIFKAGTGRRYSYRLSWVDDIPYPEAVARVTGTWSGLGGRPGYKRPDGVQKFVIDFQGPIFAGLGRSDGVDLVVTASRGDVSNSYNHPVVDQRLRWRAFFDITAIGNDPVDLRAFLRRDQKALTETWIYQYFPGA